MADKNQLAGEETIQRKKGRQGQKQSQKFLFAAEVGSKTRAPGCPPYWLCVGSWADAMARRPVIPRQRGRSTDARLRTEELSRPRRVPRLRQDAKPLWRRVGRARRAQWFGARRLETGECRVDGWADGAQRRRRFEALPLSKPRISRPLSAFRFDRGLASHSDSLEGRMIERE